MMRGKGKKDWVHIDEIRNYHFILFDAIKEDRLRNTQQRSMQ